MGLILSAVLVGITLGGCKGADASPQIPAADADSHKDKQTAVTTRDSAGNTYLGNRLYY
jgi:hypothetical protein